LKWFGLKLKVFEFNWEWIGNDMKLIFNGIKSLIEVIKNYFEERRKRLRYEC